MSTSRKPLNGKRRHKAHSHEPAKSYANGSRRPKASSSSTLVLALNNIRREIAELEKQLEIRKAKPARFIRRSELSPELY
jgi:hypothetical protein